MPAIVDVAWLALLFGDDLSKYDDLDHRHQLHVRLLMSSPDLFQFMQNFVINRWCQREWIVIFPRFLGERSLPDPTRAETTSKCSSWPAEHDLFI
jgi:hypothetical protein